MFILSIELIKKSSLFLAPTIKEVLLSSLTPVKAVSLGWFGTSIVQSSGAVGSIVATFAGNNLIGISTAIYILIGAYLGTTITALIISLITVSQKRRDFRHGFEIGLCYALYSAMMVFILFLLEYFFNLFSKTSLFLASTLGEKISLLKVPNWVDIITSPVVDFLFKINHKLIVLVISFLVLIFVLRYIGKSVVEVLGGERKARGFINRYFESKYKGYFIGFILTAIVFSSSITISLLVPLAVSRTIGLRKAIPFILGADLGTFTDIFLVSVILSQPLALATAFSYFLFGLLGGLIFLPNTEFLFKITKYTSKKIINISRKKLIYILIAFILIPLLIMIF
jgi:sodium-dependent phosphate cotransporter